MWVRCAAESRRILQSVQFSFLQRRKSIFPLHVETDKLHMFLSPPPRTIIVVSSGSRRSCLIDFHICSDFIRLVYFSPSCWWWQIDYKSLWFEFLVSAFRGNSLYLKRTCLCRITDPLWVSSAGAAAKKETCWITFLHFCCSETFDLHHHYSAVSVSVLPFISVWKMYTDQHVCHNETQRPMLNTHF